MFDPNELIAELARQRWLFVITRGSAFRFGSDAPDPLVGKALGVRYCPTDAVELAGPALTVTVQLADTRSGGVVWPEKAARSPGAQVPVWSASSSPRSFGRLCRMKLSPGPGA